MSIDGRHLFSFFALAFFCKYNRVEEIDQFFYTGSEI